VRVLVWDRCVPLLGPVFEVGAVGQVAEHCACATIGQQLS
jgi:hypothetical protein